MNCLINNFARQQLLLEFHKNNVELYAVELNKFSMVKTEVEKHDFRQFFKIM